MIIVGITGGIGSGKTTVSKVLTALEYPVYIADDEAKRLTNTNLFIKEGLIKLFGKKIVADGFLNKKMLADKIFNNKEKLQAVNNLIHPVVMKDFTEWKEKEFSPIIFIETAILFETPFHNMVDKKITVTSPLELRIERLLKRNHTSEQEIKSRMNSQMSDEEKIKLSDFVIVNDEKTAVLPQIQFILSCLRS